MLPSLTQGAVPSTIAYQGMLTDASDVPVADAAYSIDFSLYNVAVAGVALWTENQNLTTDGGLLSAVLGALQHGSQAVGRWCRRQKP